MTNPITQADLTAAIATKDAFIDAITELTTNGAQSYTLDTGQSRQVVTKLDLASLWTRYQSALNLCSVLAMRLGCSVGQTIMRPCF